MLLMTYLQKYVFWVKQKMQMLKYICSIFAWYLPILFNNVDGFIRDYNRTKYLALFGSEKCIFNRTRYIIILKSSI